MSGHIGITCTEGKKNFQTCTKCSSPGFPGLHIDLRGAIHEDLLDFPLL